MIIPVKPSEAKPKVEEVTVSKADLPLHVNALKSEGARFITITGRDEGATLELLYHFERGIEVRTIKVRIPKTEVMPSITGVYPVAFLAENELQDHFSLNISGLNIDFAGKIYKIQSATFDTLLKPAEGPAPFINRFMGRCREKCPGNVNAPKYIRQIAMGDPVGAYSTVIEQAPLPACLGRVCFAPCQEACRQEKNDEPIQIRLLKRYAADSMPDFKRDVKRMPSTGKKVAVIGGGPSGVGCAFYLGMMGHSVTLFEKTSRCGGAMLWGIPKYRLPKDLLEKEVQARFKEAGVTFKGDSDITELKPLFEKGFDAIYVAIGASESSKLRVEGEEAEGVLDFRDVLRSVNVENKNLKVGKRVAVVGGGNSSIDAARVSRRLGAESVVMYYRRTEKEMPASEHEIHGALDEGVNFEYLTAPVKIIPGKPLKLVLQHMQLGAPDATGRRSPEPVPGSDFTVDVDSIITAIGQIVNIPASFGLNVARNGRIVVNDSYETNIPGVWAGGDAVFGPKNVIEAFRDARIVATNIDIYLGGKGLPKPVAEINEYVPRHPNKEAIMNQEQVSCRELSGDERVKNFNEVELGFNPDEALREASRCWRCDWNE